MEEQREQPNTPQNNLHELVTLSIRLYALLEQFSIFRQNTLEALKKTFEPLFKAQEELKKTLEPLTTATTQFPKMFEPIYEANEEFKKLYETITIAIEKHQDTQKLINKATEEAKKQLNNPEYFIISTENIESIRNLIEKLDQIIKELETLKAQLKNL